MRDNAEHRVSCGVVIPEGRMMCPGCEEAEPKKYTNYDRIRNMSVEEIIDFMQKCGWDYPPYCDYRKIQECDQNCIKCAKEWLESEDEE